MNINELKIKPLVWKGDKSKYADTSIGYFHVSPYDENGKYELSYCLGQERESKDIICDTEDIAKTMAEAHWQKKAREIIVDILDIPE